MTQPPVTQPPVTQPPVTQPPVTRPPVPDGPAAGVRHVVVPATAALVDQWHLTHAVAARGLLLLTGVTGAFAGDVTQMTVREQVRHAFAHVGHALTAAGASWADVVEMTTYHVDLRTHLDAFCEVKDQFVRAPFPAWTAIGVQELITPGTLVEIRVVALDPAYGG